MTESKYFCDLCSSEISNPLTGGMTVCLLAAQGLGDPVEIHDRESCTTLSHRYRDSKRLLVCKTCAGGMDHCWGDGTTFIVGDKVGLIKKLLARFRRAA